MPGILSQAFDRRCPPAGLDLRIEQRPHAAEDERGHVGVGQQPFLVRRLAAQFGLRRVDEDVEILAHEGFLLGCRAGVFKLRQRGGAGCASPGATRESGSSPRDRARRRRSGRRLPGETAPGRRAAPARACCWPRSTPGSRRAPGLSRRARGRRRPENSDEKQQNEQAESLHGGLFHHDWVRMAASPV